MCKVRVFRMMNSIMPSIFSGNVRRISLRYKISVKRIDPERLTGIPGKIESIMRIKTELYTFFFQIYELLNRFHASEYRLMGRGVHQWTRPRQFYFPLSILSMHMILVIVLLVHCSCVSLRMVGVFSSAFVRFENSLCDWDRVKSR